MELLSCYSIHTTHIKGFINDDKYTKLCDDNMHYCIPINMIASVTDSLIDHVGFTDDITFSASESSDNFQCYHMSKSPTALDWTSAYGKDANTAIILSKLLAETKSLWSDACLSKVDIEYRSHLKHTRVRIIHNKVLLKPVFKQIKYVGLIIVPTELRRVIFSHFHVGPSDGHMGEYKTLFRIRMRLFWPSIRKDIKLWVKNCAHCCAYDVWRNRKSELYFSWPVTTPFYIMHVDLWMAGKLMDSINQMLQLMNAMCDLT